MLTAHKMFSLFFEVLQAIKEEVCLFLCKTQLLAGYDCGSWKDPDVIGHCIKFCCCATFVLKTEIIVFQDLIEYR